MMMIMMMELMTTTTDDDEGDSQDGDGDGYEEADRSGGANLTVLKFKRKAIAETNSAKKSKSANLPWKSAKKIKIYNKIIPGHISIRNL